ncbi:hypothetical protein M9H77_27251 [Catharanthus roseus]|uniref:Uncharacterized protein n=1 Tax=Catharanthus roseus TaxID=4058 RepID=A0ACC0AEQ8_CATRO|nr:hypothetical protein M9H77_27251 [Catharanthus roseus]
MEFNTRKRVARQEKQEIDEEMMEAFFAIIRRMKNTRYYIAEKSLQKWKEISTAQAIKKMKVNQQSWIPSFELEDFVEPGSSHAMTTRSNPNPSKEFTRKEEIREEEEKDLDLNLAL